MQVATTVDEGEGAGMVVKRLSVPLGLEELMESLTKQVILKKPKDLFTFASEHFAHLVALRDKINSEENGTKFIGKSAEKNKNTSKYADVKVRSATIATKFQKLPEPLILTNSTFAKNNANVPKISNKTNVAFTRTTRVQQNQTGQRTVERSHSVKSTTSTDSGSQTGNARDSAKKTSSKTVSSKTSSSSNENIDKRSLTKKSSSSNSSNSSNSNTLNKIEKSKQTLSEKSLKQVNLQKKDTLNLQKKDTLKTSKRDSSQKDNGSDTESSLSVQGRSAPRSRSRSKRGKSTEKQIQNKAAASLASKLVSTSNDGNSVSEKESSKVDEETNTSVSDRFLPTTEDSSNKQIKVSIADSVTSDVESLDLDAKNEGIRDEAPNEEEKLETIREEMKISPDALQLKYDNDKEDDEKIDDNDKIDYQDNVDDTEGKDKTDDKEKKDDKDKIDDKEIKDDKDLKDDKELKNDKELKDDKDKADEKGKSDEDKIYDKDEITDKEMLTNKGNVTDNDKISDKNIVNDDDEIVDQNKLNNDVNILSNEKTAQQFKSEENYNPIITEASVDKVGKEDDPKIQNDVFNGTTKEENETSNDNTKNIPISDLEVNNLNQDNIILQKVDEVDETVKNILVTAKREDEEIVKTLLEKKSIEIGDSSMSNLKPVSGDSKDSTGVNDQDDNKTLESHIDNKMLSAISSKYDKNNKTVDRKLTKAKDEAKDNFRGVADQKTSRKLKVSKSASLNNKEKSNKSLVKSKNKSLENEEQKDKAILTSANIGLPNKNKDVVEGDTIDSKISNAESSNKQSNIDIKQENQENKDTIIKDNLDEKNRENEVDEEINDSSKSSQGINAENFGSNINETSNLEKGLEAKEDGKKTGKELILIEESLKHVMDLKEDQLEDELKDKLKEQVVSSDSNQNTDKNVDQQLIENGQEASKNISKSAQEIANQDESTSSNLITLTNSILTKSETDPNSINDNKNDINKSDSNILSDNLNQVDEEEINHEKLANIKKNERFNSEKASSEDNTIEEQSIKSPETSLRSPTSHLSMLQAVLDIQSAWRRYKNRRDLQKIKHSMKSEENLLKAVTTIQSFFRGYLSRKKGTISNNELDETLKKLQDIEIPTEEPIIDGLSTNLEENQSNEGKGKSEENEGTASSDSHERSKRSLEASNNDTDFEKVEDSKSSSDLIKADENVLNLDNSNIQHVPKDIIYEANKASIAEDIKVVETEEIADAEKEIHANIKKNEKFNLEKEENVIFNDDLDTNAAVNKDDHEEVQNRIETSGDNVKNTIINEDTKKQLEKSQPISEIAKIGEEIGNKSMIISKDEDSVVKKSSEEDSPKREPRNKLIANTWDFLLSEKENYNTSGDHKIREDSGSYIENDIKNENESENHAEESSISKEGAISTLVSETNKLLNLVPFSNNEVLETTSKVTDEEENEAKKFESEEIQDQSEKSGNLTRTITTVLLPTENIPIPSIIQVVRQNLEQVIDSESKETEKNTEKNENIANSQDRDFLQNEIINEKNSNSEIEKLSNSDEIKSNESKSLNLDKFDSSGKSESVDFLNEERRNESKAFIEEPTVNNDIDPASEEVKSNEEKIDTQLKNPENGDENQINTLTEEFNPSSKSIDQNDLKKDDDLLKNREESQVSVNTDIKDSADSKNEDRVNIINKEGIKEKSELIPKSEESKESYEESKEIVMTKTDPAIDKVEKLNLDKNDGTKKGEQLDNILKNEKFNQDKSEESETEIKSQTVSNNVSNEDIQSTEAQNIEVLENVKKNQKFNEEKTDSSEIANINEGQQNVKESKDDIENIEKNASILKSNIFNREIDESIDNNKFESTSNVEQNETYIESHSKIDIEQNNQKSNEEKAKIEDFNGNEDNNKKGLVQNKSNSEEASFLITVEDAEKLEIINRNQKFEEQKNKVLETSIHDEESKNNFDKDKEIVNTPSNEQQQNILKNKAFNKEKSFEVIESEAKIEEIEEKDELSNSKPETEEIVNDPKEESESIKNYEDTNEKELSSKNSETVNDQSDDRNVSVNSDIVIGNNTDDSKITESDIRENEDSNKNQNNLDQALEASANSKTPKNEDSSKEDDIVEKEPKELLFPKDEENEERINVEKSLKFAIQVMKALSEENNDNVIIEEPPNTEIDNNELDKIDVEKTTILDSKGIVANAENKSNNNAENEEKNPINLNINDEPPIDSSNEVEDAEAKIKGKELDAIKLDEKCDTLDKNASKLKSAETVEKVKLKEPTLQTEDISTKTKEKSKQVSAKSKDKEVPQGKMILETNKSEEIVSKAASKDDTDFKTPNNDKKQRKGSNVSAGNRKNRSAKSTSDSSLLAKSKEKTGSQNMKAKSASSITKDNKKSIKKDEQQKTILSEEKNDNKQTEITATSEAGNEANFETNTEKSEENNKSNNSVIDSDKVQENEKMTNILKNQKFNQDKMENMGAEKAAENERVQESDKSLIIDDSDRSSNLKKDTDISEKDQIRPLAITAENNDSNFEEASTKALSSNEDSQQNIAEIKNKSVEVILNIKEPKIEENQTSLPTKDLPRESTESESQNLNNILEKQDKQTKEINGEEAANEDKIDILIIDDSNYDEDYASLPEDEEQEDTNSTDSKLIIDEIKQKLNNIKEIIEEGSVADFEENAYPSNRKYSVENDNKNSRKNSKELERGNSDNGDMIKIEEINSMPSNVSPTSMDSAVTVLMTEDLNKMKQEEEEEILIETKLGSTVINEDNSTDLDKNASKLPSFETVGEVNKIEEPSLQTEDSSTNINLTNEDLSKKDLTNKDLPKENLQNENLQNENLQSKDLLNEDSKNKDLRNKDLPIKDPPNKTEINNEDGTLLIDVSNMNEPNNNRIEDFNQNNVKVLTNVVLAATKIQSTFRGFRERNKKNKITNSKITITKEMNEENADSAETTKPASAKKQRPSLGQFLKALSEPTVETNTFNSDSSKNSETNESETSSENRNDKVEPKIKRKKEKSFYLHAPDSLRDNPISNAIKASSKLTNQEASIGLLDSGELRNPYSTADGQQPSLPLTPTLGLDESPNESNQKLLYSSEFHDSAINIIEKEVPAGVQGVTSSGGVAQASLNISGDDLARQIPRSAGKLAGSVSGMEGKRNNAAAVRGINHNNNNNCNNMESQAATKIQASFRGYQVRKQMKSKNGGDIITPSNKRSNRRKTSSTNMPDKKKVKEDDLEEKSATKIQAGIRGFLVRRRHQKKI